MTEIILITGGARSGKSTFAEKLSREKNVGNGKKIAYIATSEIVDKEFEERIRIHRSRRGDEFMTYEENIGIMKTIHDNYHVHDIFVVECLTTWLGNIFYRRFETRDKFVEESFVELLDLPPESGKTLIFVSNEVGLGIVPDNELSRIFRDMQGGVNSRMASLASEVYFTVSGIPVRIK